TQRSSMRSVASLAVCLVLLQTASPYRAIAAHTPTAKMKLQAKAEADKATVAFKLGRFEEALAGYARAYELFQASGLLFNIGQCHRKLGHHEKAVSFLSGYLRDHPHAPNAEDVAELIEEERKKIEQAKQAASMPATQPDDKTVVSSAPVLLREPQPA